MKQTILTCDVCGKEVGKLYDKNHSFSRVGDVIDNITLKNNDNVGTYLDIRLEPREHFDICEECVMQLIKQKLFPEGTVPESNNDSGTSN